MMGAKPKRHSVGSDRPGARLQRSGRPARRVLRPALALVVALLSGPASGQDATPLATAYVYKPDGTRHCDETAGVAIESMAQELVRAGISVHTRRKSHDGREGIAVCGSPTGSINVFEIEASDVPRAIELGFRRLEPSWLDAR